QVLEYDYLVRVTDCRLDPQVVVETFRSLMRRGATRFLLRVPEGGFRDCLEIVRRIHQSFLFISLNVVDTDAPMLRAVKGEVTL
ncbi:MAG: hypothetical protein LRS43_04965, partial [Desulfurococcales archaeon]|nr:hypothetical protein [Desulfurococcales archaeon]